MRPNCKLFEIRTKVCRAEHLVFRASVERRDMVGAATKGSTEQLQSCSQARHTFVLSYFNLQWYDTVWYASCCSCTYLSCKSNDNLHGIWFQNQWWERHSRNLFSCPHSPPLWKPWPPWPSPPPWPPWLPPPPSPSWQSLTRGQKGWSWPPKHKKCSILWCQGSFALLQCFLNEKTLNPFLWTIVKVPICHRHLDVNCKQIVIFNKMRTSHDFDAAHLWG